MANQPQEARTKAIELCVKGEPPSRIASSLGYSRAWIYKWLQRYHSGEKAWAEDRNRRPRRLARRTSAATVEAVKETRLFLGQQGVFCGGQAIAWELEELGVEARPSLRTINRILSREGLTHRRTGRYQAKGKKYPRLPALRANQVQQMDYVGPCYLRGPLRFYSLNSVDVATGRCALSPVISKAGPATLEAIWATWCRLGIPEHLQVDNESVFYGSRRYPRGLGLLIRLCLLHEVEPWFIPMGEPWRNGVVEKFNDHYEGGFLRRVTLGSEEELRRQSLLFEHKHNTRYRYSKLRGQTPESTLRAMQQPIRFPESMTAPAYPLRRPERGRYHVVRFIRSDGQLDIFGEKHALPREAVYEYVIATVDVGEQKLSAQIDGRTVHEIPYAMPGYDAEG